MERTRFWHTCPAAEGAYVPSVKFREAPSQVDRSKRPEVQNDILGSTAQTAETAAAQLRSSESRTIFFGFPPGIRASSDYSGLDQLWRTRMVVGRLQTKAAAFLHKVSSSGSDWWQTMTIPFQPSCGITNLEHKKKMRRPRWLRWHKTLAVLRLGVPEDERFHLATKNDEVTIFKIF
ncbi:hypothetical protein SLEP1_g6383 [Rubroshorea leprosula]|uniref:Uncharacterized protein n=1 Tax=Rubroshorea leprosula TaxID=152421 RepID=A0AAV5I4U0_9ROSI|nr:hypothetical protein SLEP1_g6383 [Rubroshorea leprosula]